VGLSISTLSAFRPLLTARVFRCTAPSIQHRVLSVNLFILHGSGRLPPFPIPSPEPIIISIRCLRMRPQHIRRRRKRRTSQWLRRSRFIFHPRTLTPIRLTVIVPTIIGLVDNRQPHTQQNGDTQQKGDIPIYGNNRNTTNKGDIPIFGTTSISPHLRLSLSPFVRSTSPCYSFISLAHRYRIQRYPATSVTTR
jgi:hypothetical protein